MVSTGTTLDPATLDLNPTHFQSRKGSLEQTSSRCRQRVRLVVSLVHPFSGSFHHLLHRLIDAMRRSPQELHDFVNDYNADKTEYSCIFNKHNFAEKRKKINVH